MTFDRFRTPADPATDSPPGASGPPVTACRPGETRTLPDLRGLPAPIAMANLTTLVEQLQLVETHSADFPPGLVLALDPVAGTEVTCGQTTVTLSLSTTGAGTAHDSGTVLQTVPATG